MNQASRPGAGPQGSKSAQQRSCVAALIAAGHDSQEMDQPRRLRGGLTQWGCTQAEGKGEDKVCRSLGGEPIILSEGRWPQKDNYGVVSHLWDLTRRRNWSGERREGKRSKAPTVGARATAQPCMSLQTCCRQEAGRAGSVPARHSASGEILLLPSSLPFLLLASPGLPAQPNWTPASLSGLHCLCSTRSHRRQDAGLDVFLSTHKTQLFSR